MCIPDADKWKTEYSEAGECFRLYTTFLIGIAKGITAGNAVLFAALAYLTRDGFKANLSTIFLAVLGILASLGAIVIQKRTYKYWRLFLNRAAEIEKANDMELYKPAYIIASRGLIRSSLIVLLIYGALACFWFIVLLKASGISEISLDL